MKIREEKRTYESRHEKLFNVERIFLSENLSKLKGRFQDYIKALNELAIKLLKVQNVWTFNNFLKNKLLSLLKLFS